MNNFQNFAMFIPADILRHADGSPVLLISDEDRAAFLKYAAEKGIDLEPMTVQQRETEFKEWKKLTD
jgi:hypothetical protein